MHTISFPEYKMCYNKENMIVYGYKLNFFILLKFL
jgi:hypothetical protein